MSLPGGIGELVDTLAGTLQPGTIVLSARALQLRREANFVIDSQAGPFEARAVVLAVPAYVAANLLRSIDTTLAA